jgi:hypothetical protein
VVVDCFPSFFFARLFFFFHMIPLNLVFLQEAKETIKKPHVGGGWVSTSTNNPLTILAQPGGKLIAQGRGSAERDW